MLGIFAALVLQGGSTNAQEEACPSFTDFKADTQKLAYFSFLGRP